MGRMLLVATLMMLTGCASGPIPTREAADIPAERIFNADIVRPRAGAGSMIIKRDAGFHGSVCVFRLHANGRQFAEINPGERVHIYLDPGEHIIGVNSAVLCDSHFEAAVTLTADQTRTYRLGLSGSNTIMLHPTAF